MVKIMLIWNKSHLQHIYKKMNDVYDVILLYYVK